MIKRVEYRKFTNLYYAIGDFLGRVFLLRYASKRLVFLLEYLDIYHGIVIIVIISFDNY